ncbi:MAG TPA: MnmC family methyltransferase, partial [Polyangiaceae bacterium]
EFGLRRSALLCIAMNLCCANVALLAFPRATEPTTPNDVGGKNTPHDIAPSLRLAATGWLGIGFELVVVFVLSQLTEDTVYTFALLLAVYLVGSAAGAWAYRRWVENDSRRETWNERLLVAVSTACLFGAGSLWGAEHVKAWALSTFGLHMTGALVTETLLAVLAFLLPTCAMGALFSHLCRSAKDAGITFGRALGVNTLAAAVAPVTFGLWAVPTLGPKLALILISVGYLVLSSRQAWTPLILVPTAIAGAFALFAPPLVFVDVPPNGHVVRYEEGLMGAVSVVEDANGVGTLRINNRQQEGSNATARVDARQAWLPLLLHPNPKRALFLGLGTGVTASSAANDPALSVDAVELLAEVIAASPYFTDHVDGATRLRILAADARRYVRATDRRYDVIVSDNFHPARSGSGALYTVEHFQAVRHRLDSGGVFCQWLPLHQLDLTTLRSIVGSFLVAFPDAGAMLANYGLETPVLGLVGHADPHRFDPLLLRARLLRSPLHDWLMALGLEDEYAVLGSFIGGPQSLTRFVNSAPLNTDDHPVVAYLAPRITYAPASSPRDRLSTVLHALAIQPNELFFPLADAETSRRLVSYGAARNRFIESGRNVRPTVHVEDMLAQVREPLLTVLTISPDFRPAYDPLLSMAKGLSRSDMSTARVVLNRLAQLQPARSEAPALLAVFGNVEQPSHNDFVTH